MSKRLNQAIENYTKRYFHIIQTDKYLDLCFACSISPKKIKGWCQQVIYSLWITLSILIKIWKEVNVLTYVRTSCAPFHQSSCSKNHLACPTNRCHQGWSCFSWKLSWRLILTIAVVRIILQAAKALLCRNYIGREMEPAVNWCCLLAGEGSSLGII